MTRILAFVRDPESKAIAIDRLASDFPGVTVDRASTLAEAMPFLAETEILVSIGLHLGQDAAAIYSAAPRLRWVQSFGSGTDNMAGHPALDPGVAVTNVHGIHGNQLSEAAFAAMLSFARHLPATVRNQDARHWTHPVPTVLAGRTVGIFGLGAIAATLAPRCRAFGMRVVGISGNARDVAGFDMVFARSDLVQAVGDLDYLIILTPLTPDTKLVVGAAVLAAMKPTACLINLARGGVVDEAALIRALDSGAPAGAVLDVFEQEPLPADDPLWAHPRVIVWPHTAGFHSGYPADVYAAIADNLRRYLDGGVDALANRVQ